MKRMLLPPLSTLGMLTVLVLLRMPSVQPQLPDAPEWIGLPVTR
jgi:hypothetical protein